MVVKHSPVPTLEKMYAFIDVQLRTACTTYVPKNWTRINYLLDQRNDLPRLREFLIKMGARGA
jgi:hypothetical protein